ARHQSECDCARHHQDADACRRNSCATREDAPAWPDGRDLGHRGRDSLSGIGGLRDGRDHSRRWRPECGPLNLAQGVQAPGLLMKEDVMNRLEKVLYTAKAHTTGGRAGLSRSSDGPLQGRLSRPGRPGTGTNPEQLFAAGWSACFESAMEFAARNMKITLPVDHAVD